jgi:hypothetical protein
MMTMKRERIAILLTRDAFGASSVSRPVDRIE